MKKSALLIVIVCLSVNLFAQSGNDAIRFSQLIPSITARSMAMGGAFGAVGADFSSLSNNPAGIGLFRRSEFTVTPAFGNTSTASDFLGQKNSDNKYNFNVGNIGLIYAYPKEESNTSPWRGFAFGFGYNKLNSFHSRNFYEGLNTKNSLLDSYLEEANGINVNTLQSGPYDFSSNMAFQTYLIDTLPGSSNQYFSAIPEGGEIQRVIYETRGSAGEALFSLGGNYMNRVFWGLTLGIPYLRYNEDLIYEEIDPGDNISQTTPGIDSSYAAYFNFESFRFKRQIGSSGNGFNAKFGLIFRPNDWLRFGMAVHSPAFYSMHNEYLFQLHANYAGESYDYDKPLATLDYNMTTPFRASGSIAMLYQQNGMLSFDYEFVDYSSAKFSSSEIAFTQSNQEIRTNYGQGHNFRVGGEWKYGIFAFRLGTGYYGKIVKTNLSDSNTDLHRFIYSGGFGIREEGYFVDVAYSLSKHKTGVLLYELENDPGNAPISIDRINEHRLLVTIGFRF